MSGFQNCKNVCRLKLRALFQWLEIKKYTNNCFYLPIFIFYYIFRILPPFICVVSRWIRELELRRMGQFQIQRFMSPCLAPSYDNLTWSLDTGNIYRHPFQHDTVFKITFMETWNTMLELLRPTHQHCTSDPGRCQNFNILFHHPLFAFLPFPLT